MSFSIDRYLLTSITTDDSMLAVQGCITVDYYRLLWSIMDRYRLLSITVVPGVTHTIGIMSGEFILVVVVSGLRTVQPR